MTFLEVPVAGNPTVFFHGIVRLSQKTPGKLKGNSIVAQIPMLLPSHSNKNPLNYGNGLGSSWEGGPSIAGVAGKIPNRTLHVPS